MGLVRQNHSQIRGTKAEPADSHDAMMDQLEISSILSEENEENQPQLANNEWAGVTVSTSPQGILESTLPEAMQCRRRLRFSQRERRRPSRFKDFVMSRLKGRGTIRFKGKKLPNLLYTLDFYLSFFFQNEEGVTQLCNQHLAPHQHVKDSFITPST